MDLNRTNPEMTSAALRALFTGRELSSPERVWTPADIAEQGYEIELIKGVAVADLEARRAAAREAQAARVKEREQAEQSDARQEPDGEDEDDDGWPVIRPIRVAAH